VIEAMGAAAAAISPAAGGPATIGLAGSLAVVVFDFDPVVTFLGVSLRWQILAVAATILLALLLAAAIAIAADRRRAAALAADPERVAAVAEAVEAALQTVRATGEAGSPASTPDVDADADADAAAAVRPAVAAGSGPAAETKGAAASPDRPSLVDHPWLVSLRLDDLLFIAIAGAAGAVVGGRLGYALLYLDVYRLDPPAILDLSRGGLALAGGVALGVMTAIVVATILGAPVRRWLAVAIVPLLLALCLGKLAMILGGAGQGSPTVASWATAYAGAGPWGSLAPAVPSVPAQAIEAATTAAALVAVLLLALVRPLRRHAAMLFAVGLGLWAIGRFAVAFTWRDPALVGSLNGDQLVTLGIAIVSAVSLIGATVSIRRERRAQATPAAGVLASAEPDVPASTAVAPVPEPVPPAAEPPPAGSLTPDTSATPAGPSDPNRPPPFMGWPSDLGSRGSGD
jgi:phosphatidylglycerol:prolipoprotein diacylglycerol transferase